MAYIELDKKKIARLRKEAQQFQNDIVFAIGTDFMETIAEAENRMIFDILNGLESEPTADVVQVVRCKDCKYCKLMKDVENEKPVYLHCRMMNCFIKNDSFCSYGERKENV